MVTTSQLYSVVSQAESSSITMASEVRPYRQAVGLYNHVRVGLCSRYGSEHFIAQRNHGKHFENLNFVQQLLGDQNLTILTVVLENAATGLAGENVAESC